MNCYPFHIGEPWQASLIAAIGDRDASKNSREKSLANGRIRSIRLQAARSKGTHTEGRWLGLVAAFQCRCVMCGDSMDARQIQKDHIVPIYQGGSDGMENLQPLCQPCNASKGADSFNWVEYRMENGFYEGPQE